MLLAALIAVAAITADSSRWIPAVAAAPLVAVGLAYDIRSRRRRLVPELKGAVAVVATAVGVNA